MVLLTPFLDLSYDKADADHSVHRIISAAKPDWTPDHGSISLSRVTGGVNNIVIKASYKPHDSTKSAVTPTPILIRAYGSGSDVLVDRDREAHSHELLSRTQLSPPLLARFQNGLVYEFTIGNVAQPEDLRRPQVARAIAQKMAEWHVAVPIASGGPAPGEAKTTDHDPMTVDAQAWADIWSLMRKWVDLTSEEADNPRYTRSNLQDELRQLEARLAPPSSKQVQDSGPALQAFESVFSHCDLLCGNIIILPKENPSDPERVSFIDYEYAMPCPAAFDIANHLSEWAGFECDYANLPTCAERRAFIEAYLERWDTFASKVKLGAGRDGIASQLFEMVDNFRGVPGFFWGIWGFVKADRSDDDDDDFDHRAYAEKRLDEYFAWKDETDGTRAAGGGDIHPREKRWVQES